MIKSILLLDTKFPVLYIGNKETAFDDMRKAVCLSSIGMKQVRELYSFDSEDKEINGDLVLSYYVEKYGVKNTYIGG